jgi:hypothetical protein
MSRTPVVSIIDDGAGVFHGLRIIAVDIAPMRALDTPVFDGSVDDEGGGNERG